MSFEKTPAGTRGARDPRTIPGMRRILRLMKFWHRRTGDTFQNMDLLYLTTVGAKSGEERQSAVTRFADGDDAWLVVASVGGAARNPSWYYNIAAHPDQVKIEFGGRRLRVTPTQLEGDTRAQAWERIIRMHPRYAQYQEQTDRVLPVIRLARAD